MITRPTLAAFACAVALAVCPFVSTADEAVYLQSGEEYDGSVTGIVGDSLEAQVRGEAREFPLADVERIEFERPREFDGLETPDALSAASPLFAQALSVSTDDLKAKYPQAGYVVLRDDTVVKLESDGRYDVVRTEAWRIMEQRGADSAFQSVAFFPDREEVQILFGISVGPDGKVARVSDAASKLEAVYPTFPEYNYLQRLRFSMKTAVPGATLFLKTRVTGLATLTRPFVLDRVFWDTEPAAERSVALVAAGDAIRSVSIFASGLDAPKDALLWRVTDTPQIMPEPLMPPMSSFAPRVVLASPSAEWADLAREFAAGVEVAPLPSPEDAAVKDVYDRVRRDVRAVDVPQDALPRPPSPPAEVLKRGYGNTVEKAFLLEALLEGLGCRAHTVLVRGRGSGPLVPDVPRLKGFNNGVVRLVNADGSETWLQADDRLAALGELDPGVYGAQGLDLATGEIITVPPRSPGAEGTRRVVDVRLAPDGSAVVDDAFYLKGADARAFRDLSDMTDDEALKWASTFVGGDITGVELTAWNHSDFEMANEEEWLKFTYRVPALAQAAGDFLVLRLPNARYSPTEVGRSTRRYDLFWLGRDSADVTFTVAAPEGYAAYAVREGIERRGDGWAYAASFAKDADTGRTVTFAEKYTRDALAAPKDAYQSFREAMIFRAILRNELIVFKKGS